MRTDRRPKDMQKNFTFLEWVRVVIRRLPMPSHVYSKFRALLEGKQTSAPKRRKTSDTGAAAEQNVFVQPRSINGVDGYHISPTSMNIKRLQRCPTRGRSMSRWFVKPSSVVLGAVSN
jgi:hypothetical protein